MPQIKFLNKFVLANILKNFRWLKIRLHDFKLKHLKCPRCYSLSLRYSIYKVQSRSRLTAEACLSYHTLFHLSRTFFKFFQISLSGFDSIFAVTSRRLGYISTSFFICQELFSSFSNFFCFCSFSLSLADSLRILAQLSLFVKYYFLCF